MRENLYEDFCNLYGLQKTLRNELIPIGKTKENMIQKGLFEQDEQRAEAYKKVKEIIDDYHRMYIDEALDGVQLPEMDQYFKLYTIINKTEKEEKEIELLKQKMINNLVGTLHSHPKYKILFKGDLIKKELYEFVGDNNEKIRKLDEFKQFTTYFTGFFKNRENIYSKEEKHSTIVYRIFDDNLPKFLNNIALFKKAMEAGLAEEIKKVEDEVCSLVGIKKIDEMFSPEYFSSVLTQAGIDKYNLVIGANTNENNEKIKGLNEYINLHNQANKSKLGFFTQLYKQVLSDRQTNSFVLEEFDSSEELIMCIENYYQHLRNEIIEGSDEKSIVKLFSGIKNYAIENIYIRNDAGLTDLSAKIYGDWNEIPMAISAAYDATYNGKKKINTEAYDIEKEQKLKKNKSYSIAYLDDCLKQHSNKEGSIGGFYSKLFDKDDSIIHMIYSSHHAFEVLLNSDVSDINTDEKKAELIKNLLDSMKELEATIKPILGEGTEPVRDQVFYGRFNLIWEEVRALTAIYDKVRNFVTKKPSEGGKIKLNFENPTLLKGWDVNKEADNASVILIRNGKYYLAIMDKKSNNVFKSGIADENHNGDFYLKMNYKLLPGPNKMLPKVFFSESRIEKFAPSEDLLEKYERGTHTKGDDFSITDCHQLINFYKKSIETHEDWRNFGFNFSDTKNYEDISGFYREVEQQGYKISFSQISKEYIDKLVEEGKIFLFQIYNKDFAEFSHADGKKNLHTLYFKMLFDPENLKDVVYKLNGEGEIFFRKANIKKENMVVHEANKPIDNKNPNNAKSTSCFTYDIIKDKRYTVDKMYLHIPISMNFKSQNVGNINKKTNEVLRHASNYHVIGIDRGERNLLYITVIDKDGKIVKQRKLNTITSEVNGNAHHTDYHALLDAKEQGRKDARKNWKKIQNIKEIKAGYLSQVVHELALLMREYGDAIIVLEDLNSKFTRSRQKIEKQVYQSFERKLIEKLNYLVFKDIDPAAPGGLLNAYQLTNRFESFQKLGKQSGFLFYVPAEYTSKIDPVTGFTNMLGIKYKNSQDAIGFWKKFDSIKYNEHEKYFEFAFYYKNFTNHTYEYNKNEDNKKWTACSFGDRIESFRNKANNNKWDKRKIDVTEEIAKLFNEYGIRYVDCDIKAQICEISKKDFHERLMHLLKLIVQLRNSDKTEDYIISPIKGKNGEFFDSRNSGDYLPQDADANGAYNIARKGLWVIDKIKKADDKGDQKLNLAISKKEWLNYVQRDAEW